MPTLIDRQGRREDCWRRVGRAAPSGPDPTAAADEPDWAIGASLLVPFADWVARRDRWAAHDGPLGVLLGPADSPFEIAGELGRLGLIAIEFPTFTDGRGYSTARLLRERLGWQGELRAVGDVLRDQLFLLARCGFDAFELADGQDVEAAVSAFRDFSDAYQSGTDRPALFERRWRVAAPAR
jgi:uncharacterized protein (DUF934 family)